MKMPCHLYLSTTTRGWRRTCLTLACSSIWSVSSLMTWDFAGMSHSSTNLTWRGTPDDGDDDCDADDDDSSLRVHMLMAWNRFERSWRYSDFFFLIPRTYLSVLVPHTARIIFPSIFFLPPYATALGFEPTSRRSVELHYTGTFYDLLITIT